MNQEPELKIIPYDEELKENKSFLNSKAKLDYLLVTIAIEASHHDFASDCIWGSKYGRSFWFYHEKELGKPEIEKLRNISPNRIFDSLKKYIVGEESHVWEYLIKNQSDIIGAAFIWDGKTMICEDYSPQNIQPEAVFVHPEYAVYDTAHNKSIHSKLDEIVTQLIVNAKGEQ